MKRLPSVIATLLIIATPATVLADQVEPAPPIASQASEVAPDVEYTLRADWQVGDSYKVEVVREKLQIRKGVPRPATIRRSVSQIRVVEKTESGFVLMAVQIDPATTHDASSPLEVLGTLLSRLPRGIAFEIETNEDGVPVGVRDVEGFTAFVRLVIEKVDFVDPQVQERFRQAMNAIATPDVVEAMILMDIQVFHGLMGGSYHGGQAYDSSTEIHVGQQAIAGNVRILLRRIDEEEGLLHIAVQSLLDDAADALLATNLAKALLEGMGKQVQQGGTWPTLRMQGTLKIQDTIEYVFDLSRNLPTEVSWEKYVKAGEYDVVLVRKKFRLLPPA